MKTDAQKYSTVNRKKFEWVLSTIQLKIIQNWKHTTKKLSTNCLPTWGKLSTLLHVQWTVIPPLSSQCKQMARFALHVSTTITPLTCTWNCYLAILNAFFSMVFRLDEFVHKRYRWYQFSKYKEMTIKDTITVYLKPSSMSSLIRLHWNNAGPLKLIELAGESLNK